VLRKAPLKRGSKGMKRTGFLPRTGRLARVSKKRAKQIRDDGDCLDEFCRKFDRCAICWAGKRRRRLVVHHIAHPNRCNDRANLLRLCAICHDQYHVGGQSDRSGRKIPHLCHGHIIAAKREADPQGFDLARLCELHQVKSLGARWADKEIPAYYLAERTKHSRAA